MQRAGPPAPSRSVGTRTFPFTRELWIEQEDFMEVPTKGYFRFYPPIGDAAGQRACA